MMNALASAHQLIERARTYYVEHPAVLAELDALERRLNEPLRVALIGSVKAGKSTLLNGLLGERIAPTDSRECTKIVTWYRHGEVPRVRAQTIAGDTVSVPARRQTGRLELELHGLDPETVERLDITWPAPGMDGLTLIDTPGTVSISERVSHQTSNFLMPEDGAAGADAVIYLLRSLHESDVHYLRAMREHTRHGQASLGTIAVLSRADELASGKLTAMMSINDAVARLRNDSNLQGLCDTIVPVAGLMGMGAMTLTQADFTALRVLAERDPKNTRQVLITAERFIAAKDEALPAERARIDLVDRYGMYGICLAVALIRGGIDDAEALSCELLRRSGLEELRRVIDVQFRQRQHELKAHSVVLALHRLVRQYPVAGIEDLLVDTDEHMKRSHAFTEMQLMGQVSSGKFALPNDLTHDLEQMIGGRGSSPATRLGVDEATTDERLIALAAEQLTRWRDLLSNPLLDQSTRDACLTAERSCERMITDLMSNMETTLAATTFRAPATA